MVLIDTLLRFSVHLNGTSARVAKQLVRYYLKAISVVQVRFPRRASGSDVEMDASFVLELQK